MGKRGPQPKPNWLRVLDGNPGQRSTQGALEAPPVAYVEPPRELDATEREVWNRLCDVLSGVRALTRQDQFALARYCELLCIYRKAADWMKSQSDGNVVYPVRDKNGTTRSIRTLPQLKAMLEISNHLLRLEAHFGLTPSSRINFGNNGGASVANPDNDPFA